MKDKLKQINETRNIKPYSQGKNIRGASESYYNKFYMVGKCFTEEELSKMDEISIDNLLKLADFAGEVFY